MLAVLVWRLPEVEWHDLIPKWTPAAIWWLIASGALMFGAFALSTLRWQRVLSALVDPPPFRWLFGVFLAGQFVSNVLPTAFGGDVIRISRVRSRIDSTAIAVASVTIDRLTGWLVLPTISLTALALTGGQNGGVALRTAVTIDVVTLIAMTAILTAAGRSKWLSRQTDPTGWRGTLAAIRLGVHGLAGHRSRALGVLLAGLTFQFGQCLAVWCAARALGIPGVGFGAVMAFFPAAAIAQNLPIGFGGLGVREGIFVVFFGSLGAPKAACITLGLLVYLLTVATSALGAPAFAFGRRGSRLSVTADDTSPRIAP